MSEPEWDSEAAFVPLSIRTKVKTRPAEVDTEVSPAPVVVETLEEAKVVPVKQETLSILTALYSSPDTQASKSVEWDVFVRVMADVGFAAKHSGGSAVTLEDQLGKTTSNLGDKIIFHKPHAISKIDPVMMRSMGKRLSKWFGWHRDMFVLENDVHVAETTV